MMSSQKMTSPFPGHNQNQENPQGVAEDAPPPYDDGDYYYPSFSIVNQPPSEVQAVIFDVYDDGDYDEDDSDYCTDDDEDDSDYGVDGADDYPSSNIVNQPTSGVIFNANDSNTVPVSSTMVTDNHIIVTHRQGCCCGEIIEKIGDYFVPESMDEYCGSCWECLFYFSIYSIVLCNEGIKHESDTDDARCCCFIFCPIALGCDIILCPCKSVYYCHNSLQSGEGLVCSYRCNLALQGQPTDREHRRNVISKQPRMA